MPQLVRRASKNLSEEYVANLAARIRAPSSHLDQRASRRRQVDDDAERPGNRHRRTGGGDFHLAVSADYPRRRPHRLSTFTHVAPETICMYLDGLDEPIRCTPNHITWSVEAKDFVEAHVLHPGNLVLCDDGPRKISRVEKIAEPIRVYNLEVQGQHVYQVSSLGMLVHNASPAPMGADGGGASSFANNYLQRLLGNLRGESNVVRALNRQVSRGLATADDIVALEQAAAQRAILTDRLSMMLAHPN